MHSRFLLIAVTAVLSACLGSNGAVMAQAKKEIINSIGMKLVLIPKGTFQMGSPPSEMGSQDNERQYKATISQDFYLGAFEVTQAQYLELMKDNPSFFQGKEFVRRIPEKRHPQTNRLIEDEKVIPIDSSRHPVERVSWVDAVEFCRLLSELPEEKKAGRVYRLPTEAEWEYACRAGSETAYCFGDDESQLERYCWFANNSGSTEFDALALFNRLAGNAEKYADVLFAEGCSTHPVGKKKPNIWGVYDMHGNVFEWCSDWYGDYPRKPVIDPVGPDKGDERVYRGGSWFFDARGCRSALRGKYDPSFQRNLLGFRVALTPPTGSIK
jgi:formylglycine-generating enzyme required for sulfatase activity